MVCKNICVDYKAKKPVGGMRYLAGQKRCKSCDVFLNWEALDVPAAQRNYELVQGVET